ncbi:hypothetical protein GC089_00160 [Cellulomonas sp. JZ18]|uniref:hypothetical protein n=1 Tax=Cellulomonas sp. JZ18 TaxID=2654191 RepID=UPI0012D42601|nr:hypothetical protein [Cellulomonas sp. JZ18]QGQ17964.1 hypothetical protein GC089_00160 [Cellulomonas sp. JZ18]
MTASRRGLALLVVPVLLALGACSRGPSYDEVEACNRVHAWDAGGREADGLERAAARAREALEGAAGSRLASAAEQLADGDATDAASRAEAFLAACRDLGWDLPEG